MKRVQSGRGPDGGTRRAEDVRTRIRFTLRRGLLLYRVTLPHQFAGGRIKGTQAAAERAAAIIRGQHHGLLVGRKRYVQTAVRVRWGSGDEPDRVIGDFGLP
jgi:hypothetical protein